MSLNEYSEYRPGGQSSRNKKKNIYLYIRNHKRTIITYDFHVVVHSAGVRCRRDTGTPFRVFGRLSRPGRAPDHHRVNVSDETVRRAIVETNTAVARREHVNGTFAVSALKNHDVYLLCTAAFGRGEGFLLFIQK